jgi:hypothetical protein
MESMNEELENIAQLRYALVDARSNHRVAQDELKRITRRVKNEIMRNTAPSAFGTTATERADRLADAVDGSPDVENGWRNVRMAEKESEMILARLENALMGIRQQEWFVRERLADAIAEYATRPCMGLGDHGIGDTLVDSTGENGVFTSSQNNNYIKRMEKTA